MSQGNLDWRNSGFPKNCAIIKSNGEANFSQFFNESECNVSAISINQTGDLTRSSRRVLRSEKRRRISSIKFGASVLCNTISPVAEYSECCNSTQRNSLSFQEQLCSPIFQPIVKVHRLSENQVRDVTHSPCPTPSTNGLIVQKVDEILPKISFCTQTSYETVNETPVKEDEDQVRDSSPDTPKLTLLIKNPLAKENLTRDLLINNSKREDKENQSFKREHLRNRTDVTDASSHDDTCPSKLKEFTARDFSSINGTSINLTTDERSTPSAKVSSQKKETVTCRRCKKIILNKKAEKVKIKVSKASEISVKTDKSVEETRNQESSVSALSSILVSERRPARRLQLVNEDDSEVPDERPKRKISSEKKSKKVYRKKRTKKVNKSNKTMNESSTIDKSNLEDSLIVPRSQSTLSNFLTDDDIHPVSRQANGSSISEHGGKHSSIRENTDITRQVNDEDDIEKNKKKSAENFMINKSRGTILENSEERDDNLETTCEAPSEKVQKMAENIYRSKEDTTKETQSQLEEVSEGQNSFKNTTGEQSIDPVNNKVNKDSEKISDTSCFTSEQRQDENETSNRIEFEETETINSTNKETTVSDRITEEETVDSKTESTNTKDDNETTSFEGNLEHNSNESLKLMQTPEKNDISNATKSDLTTVGTEKQIADHNQIKEKLHKIESFNKSRITKRSENSAKKTRELEIVQPMRPSKRSESREPNEIMQTAINVNVTKSTPARSIQHLTSVQEGEEESLQNSSEDASSGIHENSPTIVNEELTIVEENPAEESENIEKEEFKRPKSTVQIEKKKKRKSHTVSEELQVKTLRRSTRKNSNPNLETTVNLVSSLSNTSDAYKTSNRTVKKVRSKDSQKKITTLSKKSRKGNRSNLSSKSNFDDSDDSNTKRSSNNRRISKNVSTMLIDSPDKGDDTFSRISRSSRFSRFSSANSTRKSFMNSVNDESMRSRRSSFLSSRWRISKVESNQPSLVPENNKSQRKSKKIISKDLTQQSNKEQPPPILKEIERDETPRVSFSTQSLYKIHEEETNNDAINESTVVENNTMVQQNSINSASMSFAPVNFIASTPRLGEIVETPPSRSKKSINDKTNSGDMTSYKFKKKKRRETIFVPKITDSSKGLRRSKRKRVRPLLHECGERIKYTYNPTARSYEIDQVIKPIKDKKKGLRNSIASNKKRILALEKLEKKRDKENTTIRFANKTLPAQLYARDILPDNDSFEVSINGERRVKQLIKRFNREIEFEDDPMIVNSTQSSAINYAHVRGGGTKSISTSKSELTLILLYGKVKFSLDENEGYLDTGDSLGIPSDVNVTIENLRRDPATFLMHEN